MKMAYCLFENKKRHPVVYRVAFTEMLNGAGRHLETAVGYLPLRSP